MSDIHHVRKCGGFDVYEMLYPDGTSLSLAICMSKRGTLGYWDRLTRDIPVLLGSAMPPWQHTYKSILVSTVDACDASYGYCWKPDNSRHVMRLSNLPLDYPRLLANGTSVPRDLSHCPLRSPILKDIRSYLGGNILYTTDAVLRDIGAGHPASLYSYEDDALQDSGIIESDKDFLEKRRKTYLYRKYSIKNDGWSYACECRGFVGFDPFTTSWEEVDRYCSEIRL